MRGLPVGKLLCVSRPWFYDGLVRGGPVLGRLCVPVQPMRGGHFSVVRRSVELYRLPGRHRLVRAGLDCVLELRLGPVSSELRGHELRELPLRQDQC